MPVLHAGNTASPNMAPALKLADLTENAFSLEPCTFFQTHFHVRSSGHVRAWGAKTYR